MEENSSLIKLNAVHQTIQEATSVSLIKLNAVHQAIQEATSVQDVKGTIDMLAAIKVYAQQKKEGQEIQFKIAEYIIKAECRLGEMLQAAKAAGQITHAHDPRHKPVVLDADNRVTTLSEVGISRNLSSRAQQIASIPKEDREKLIAEAKATGEATKLSSQSIIRASKKKNRKPSVQSEYRDKVIKLYDAKVTLKEIAKQTGVSFRNVRDAVEKERIRRKAVKDATADIKIPREMLSLTALEKLDRAIKQEKERLSREFKTIVAQQVNDDIKLRLEGISERWHAEQDLAKRVLHARKGFMPKKVYRLIISCLHPDKFDQIVNLISSGKLMEIDSMKAKHSDAFRMFKQFEKFLLDEKESPTTFVPLPRTMEEWAARKAQVIAERKAAKAAKKVDLSPAK
jgi:hypothetical protein